jgi:hypothetical protein
MQWPNDNFKKNIFTSQKFALIYIYIFFQILKPTLKAVCYVKPSLPFPNKLVHEKF